MCPACIHDPLSGAGTWRQQVDACAATNNPLYPVRPTSHPPRDAEMATSGPETAPESPQETIQAPAQGGPPLADAPMASQATYAPFLADSSLRADIDSGTEPGASSGNVDDPSGNV